MGIGTLEKYVVLVFTVWITVSGPHSPAALAAEHEAGMMVSEWLQREEPATPLSPGAMHDAEGLIAYSSLQMPEGNWEVRRDRQVRKVAGRPRSPEPSTLILMGFGLLGLAGIGKRIGKTASRRPPASAPSARLLKGLRLPAWLK